DLMSAVWPDTFVEESNLSSNISTLRRQLGATPEGGDFIQTIPKRGYRFAAAVKQVQDEDSMLLFGQPLGSEAAPAGEADPNPTSGQAPAPEEATAAGSIRKRAVRPGVLAAAAVLVVMA